MVYVIFIWMIIKFYVALQKISTMKKSDFGYKVQDPETYAKFWATKNSYFKQTEPSPPSIDHIKDQIQTMELALIKLKSDIARMKFYVNRIAGEEVYKIPETSPLPGINPWDVKPSSPQLVKETV